MTGRLAPAIEASALMRRAQADGGFGAVLAKGDPERGALLLVVRQRGRFFAILERQLVLDDAYRWNRVGPAAESVESTIDEFVAKRRRFDTDLWLIELDVADGERFIAETTGID